MRDLKNNLATLHLCENKKNNLAAPYLCENKKLLCETKKITMTENELSRIIVNTAFNIHTKLGPGLFESVYEEIMNYELTNSGLFVERQKEVPVYWDNLKMEIGFRADLIINNKVIIELKSVKTIEPVHPKQLLTYLKLTNLKLGLLINFNEALIKDGITRIVNNLLFCLAKSLRRKDYFSTLKLCEIKKTT